MYFVKILKYDPDLFHESLKSYAGQELYFSQYDLLNLQSKAHTDCPDKLVNIDARPAPMTEYLGQELHDGDSILFSRTGGAGDIMMILPIIQRIKQQHSSVKIGFATRSRFGDLARMSPHVDVVHTIPVLAQYVSPYTYVAHFYDAIEFPHQVARTEHGCNVFARRLRLPDLSREEMRVELTVPKGATKSIAHRLKKTGIKPQDTLILFQYKSSNVNRTYPPQRSPYLVYALSRLTPNTHVIVTGGTNDCGVTWHDQATGAQISNIHNWTGQTDIYDMGALVQRANLCIGPDSFLTHLGGAMGVPTLGLFNVVPPELRVGQYDNVMGMFARYECAPCFSHGRSHCSKCTILIRDWEQRHKADEPKPGAPCWDTITNREVCRNAARLLGLEGSNAQ